MKKNYYMMLDKNLIEERILLDLMEKIRENRIIFNEDPNEGEKILCYFNGYIDALYDDRKISLNMKEELKEVVYFIF